MIDRNAPITITLTMSYDEWCEINEALDGYGYDCGFVSSMVTLGEYIDEAQAKMEALSADVRSLVNSMEV